MRTWVRVGGAAVAMALTLTACAESQRDAEGGGEAGEATSEGRDSFIFAASGDPAGLDPALANDGETFRVARQIFEGLVGTDPGTPRPAGPARAHVAGRIQTLHLLPRSRNMLASGGGDHPTGNGPEQQPPDEPRNVKNVRHLAEIQP